MCRETAFFLCVWPTVALCARDQAVIGKAFALKVITFCTADRQTIHLQTNKKISLNGARSEENTNKD